MRNKKAIATMAVILIPLFVFLGNRMGFFKIQELIGPTAIIISLLTLIYTVYRDIIRNKEDLTIRFYEKWTSPAFQQLRDDTYALFEQLYVPGRKVNVNDIYPLNPSVGSFGFIQHFFDDLGCLAKQEKLDKNMSVALFKNVADEWTLIFKQIDWSGDSSRKKWWEENLEPHLEELYKFWGEEFEEDVSKAYFHERTFIRENKTSLQRNRNKTNYKELLRCGIYSIGYLALRKYFLKKS